MHIDKQEYKSSCLASAVYLSIKFKDSFLQKKKKQLPLISTFELQTKYT